MEVMMPFLLHFRLCFCKEEQTEENYIYYHPVPINAIS